MKKSVFFVNGVCSANSQAKRLGLLAGMAALLLTFGLVLTGCGDDDGGGGGTAGEELPAATGANELSGKTYFDHNGKIEFAATAENAKSGNYKKSEIDRDSVDSGGEIIYIEYEKGTYSWDATSKKVVLKPVQFSTKEGKWMDAAGYKQYQQEWFDAYKADKGEVAANALVPEGFSPSEYIDYMVNEAFANTTFAYALVANGAALLMSQELPSSAGENELLKGKNFKNNRNTNETYVFSDTSYTYTNSYTPSDNATGTYAWNAREKKVYLKPSTIDGKTNLQYFESLSVSVSDAVSRAAYTNVRFGMLTDYTYNLDNLTMDR
jgi:hypothetical protein